MGLLMSSNKVLFSRFGYMGKIWLRFKEEFGLENYVKFHMSKRNRSLLVQCCLGILHLNIEISRYNKMPINERLCELCNTNI